MLWESLKNSEVFEHFTHDASILPIEYYPVWDWQFKHMIARLERSKNWNIDTALNRKIKSRIRAEGPLSTHAFDTKITGKKEMWSRPPHKRALDYMWYVGDLATSHRENFTKYYDIPKRVIPQRYLTKHFDGDKLSWLCEQALTHLSIATAADLQDFWGAASAAQIKLWLSQASSDFQSIEIEMADGQYLSLIHI